MSKTAMMLAIENLKQRQANIKKICNDGLIDNSECCHKHNELESFLTVLSKLMNTVEREQIENAYDTCEYNPLDDGLHGKDYYTQTYNTKEDKS